eukprot:499788_1
MDTDHIFIKMLYIEFKHILSYPQTNSFGIISPAKIVQYGIRTVTVPQSTIYLRLYWNTYLYLCTLDITTENELYLCDITYCIEPTQQSNYEYHFALTITMDNKNSFEIDHVFVKDESGYEYDIYRFCQQLQSETPNSLAKCNQFDNLYQYSSVRICYDDVECKTNSLLALIFPNKLFDRDHRDPNANNDKESMILYYPQYVLNDQLLCENNWTLFPTISPNYLPTQLLTNVPTISTSNVINNTTQKPGEDSDSMMQQIQPYIVFGAVLLTIILCATVIGCCFYVKSLHKKLNHKSPSMQSQNHNNNNRDMDAVTKLSGLTQLELVKLPSILQPGMKSHVTTESAIIKEGNKEPNRDDSSSLSIHTDESQKVLDYHETAEGEEKETKIESAVHLEIKNYDSNDDKNEDEKEDEKEDMLLDSMLADVMKMESIDPYKIGNDNEKKNNENETDSDDSDDMYDKSESDINQQINKAKTDDKNYIYSIENENENEGLDENENKIDMDENDDDVKIDENEVDNEKKNN